MGLLFCTLSARPAHAISGTVVQTKIYTAATNRLDVTVNYTWSSGFASPQEKVTSSVVHSSGYVATTGQTSVFSASGNGSGTLTYFYIGLGSGTYTLQGKLLETNNGDYVIASETTKPFTL